MLTWSMLILRIRIISKEYSVVNRRNFSTIFIGCLRRVLLAASIFICILAMRRIGDTSSHKTMMAKLYPRRKYALVTRRKITSTLEYAWIFHNIWIVYIYIKKKQFHSLCNLLFQRSGLVICKQGWKLRILKCSLWISMVIPCVLFLKIILVVV